MSLTAAADFTTADWKRTASETLGAIDTRLFIDGDYRESPEGGRFESTDPATGESIAVVTAASPEDIEVAMTKGVNYPKGLLAWGDELGAATVLATLDALQAEYGEDRYRPSPLLRRTARGGGKLLP